MHCTSCGTLLPPGASVCPNCGAPVAVPQPVPSQPAPSQPLERTPSFYDEYIPFTDQETPPIAAPVFPPPPSFPPPPPSTASYMQTTAAGEALTTPPMVNPTPPPRRTPFLILTTTLSILSLLVIIVLVFLLVHPTNHTVPTPTNQFATSDPQAIYTQVTSRTPTINDGFSSNSWAATTTGSCVVSGTSLHATAPQGSDVLCGSTALKVSNFACQVQITLTTGDTVGLIFRANTTSLQAYIIELTSQGTYLLGSGQSGTTNFKVLAEGNNNAINAGHGLSNLLTIIAQRNILYIYVNKQFVISTSDSASSSGLVGIVGGGTITNVAVDATLSHFQLWNLS
jgi:hypothetical protein